MKSLFRRDMFNSKLINASGQLIIQYEITVDEKHQVKEKYDK